MDVVICLCGSDNGYDFDGFEINYRIHHCACGLTFTYDPASNLKWAFTKRFAVFSDKNKIIKVSYKHGKKEGYEIEANYYIENNLWRSVVDIIDNIDYKVLFAMSSEELTSKIEQMMILI